MHDIILILGNDIIWEQAKTSFHARIDQNISVSNYLTPAFRINEILLTLQYGPR